MPNEFGAVHPTGSRISVARALRRRVVSRPSRIGTANVLARGGLPQTGFIDDTRTIPYFFHGIGCRVIMPTGSVDWDFGHEGRSDGFDFWRLRQFAEHDTKEFPEFADEKILESTFTLAIKRGIIHAPFKDQHDELYYLRSANEQSGAADQ